MIGEHGWLMVLFVGWKRTQRLQGELHLHQALSLLPCFCYVTHFFNLLLFLRETKVKEETMALMDARWVPDLNITPLHLFFLLLFFLLIMDFVMFWHVPLVFLFRVKLVSQAFLAVKVLLDRMWVVHLNHWAITLMMADSLTCISGVMCHQMFTCYV